VHPQLPFNFGADSGQTFGSFWAGENQLLVNVLTELAAADRGDRQIYISGVSGVGKTHLLTAACGCATASGNRIAYLPASSVTDAGALLGLGEFDLVCIDDLQQLPVQHESEVALFNLINVLREHDGRLLLAADRVASSLAVRLEDLATRLGWGASYRVALVPGEQLVAALSLRAERMGMQVSSDVFDYLLQRCPREINALIQRLQFIDQASLRAKRRLTVPFVRAALQEYE